MRREGASLAVSALDPEVAHDPGSAAAPRLQRQHQTGDDGALAGEKVTDQDWYDQISSFRVRRVRKQLDHPQTLQGKNSQSETQDREQEHQHAPARATPARKESEISMGSDLQDLRRNAAPGQLVT